MKKETTPDVLKRLRGNKTLEQVANALEISVSALSMYETGQRVPRDLVKKRIAQHYGKSVQYIFFR